MYKYKAAADYISSEAELQQNLIFWPLSGPK